MGRPKKPVEPSGKAILTELAKRAEKPLFDIHKYCFDKQLALIVDPADFATACTSRRCLAKGTMVATPTGARAIETLRVGDFVYDEFSKPAKVLEFFDQGMLPVQTLSNNGSAIVTATKDHKFLTTELQNTKQTKERTFEEFYYGVKIVRREYFAPMGDVNEPHAYVIGAFLGDGCKHAATTCINVSGADEGIIKKCALLMESTYKKMHRSNYTWEIRGWFNYYEKWMLGKYSHNKDIDFEVVKTWNRRSLCDFLAGLIDTDGSLSLNKDGSALRIGMQNKKALDVAHWILLSLWGANFKFGIDNRPKYKNGPVHTLTLKHNYFVNKILEELAPYIQCERKKQFRGVKNSNNFNPSYMGGTLSDAGHQPCYDISVDSYTQLFLLSNGLVSHNSGKTIGAAGDLTHTALSREGIVCLYITLSRASAKRIIWPELTKINREFQLGAVPNIADLSLTFPNGSVIYCSGAKNKSEIEKFRGLPIALCYIDEAQSFGAFIKDLIDDVISKALYDYNGRLRVTGTPPPIPTGYFHEICHSPEWSHHHWDMRQNPWLHKKSGKTPMELIERDLKRKGVTIEDPGIQRECFGRWVTDSNALVFRYNKNINSFFELPEGNGIGWNYIFGIDIGFDDADAIAVIAYHEHIKEAYLVEEHIKRKQGVTELANQIEALVKIYNPVSMVMDSGGLGKKINEEFSRRFSLGIKAAEKSRKFEYIELLNDAFRTKKFFARETGQFAEDSQLVEWNRDKSTGDRFVVSDRFHSDITDAVLYAFRESLHFLAEDVPSTIRPGTAEWIEKQKVEMEETARQMMEASKQDSLDSIGAKHIDWKVDD